MLFRSWMKEYPLLNKTNFWNLNDFSKFDSRFAILGSYSIKGLSNRFKNVVNIFNDDGDIKYREVLKIVILSVAKNPDSFKINKIDSSLRSE